MDQIIDEVAKSAALKELEERRRTAPPRKDNSSLPAGSPMYYYCQSCSHLACVISESDFTTRVASHCRSCQSLKSNGWL